MHVRSGMSGLMVKRHVSCSSWDDGNFCCFKMPLIVCKYKLSKVELIKTNSSTKFVSRLVSTFLIPADKSSNQRQKQERQVEFFRIEIVQSKLHKSPQVYDRDFYNLNVHAIKIKVRNVSPHLTCAQCYIVNCVEIEHGTEEAKLKPNLITEEGNGF